MPCKSHREYCKALNDALEDEANARRKGFVQIVISKLETPDRRVAGVAYKTSARDRGLMINHCPWCGVDLTAGFSAPAPATPVAAREIEDLGPTSLPADVDALLAGAVEQAERDVTERHGVEG